jgi:tetratricopeptide (TPR) repeat protein
MKKLIAVFILLFAISSVFAQKALRTDAYNYLRKGQLDKAIKSIEPTISDPSTMNDPKTWFYRGNIMLQIHMSPDSTVRGLEPDALAKAFESYKKTIELDSKKEYYIESVQNLSVISEQAYNSGVEEFKNANYDKALEYFEKAAEVSTSFGNVDTLAIFNAGLSAENAKNNPKAVEHYTKVIELNYPQPLIYSSLANIYLAEKDTTKAFEIVAQGREKYPEEFALLIAETNLHLGAGQTEQAMENLQEAVKTDPLNPTIHYAVGASYDQMGNKSEAEKAYLKAIELKPDYFEANYNLGALYVNQAAEIITEANKLKLNDPNYEVMKKEADDILQKSLPHLETASSLDPKDRSTLLALKEIYTRLSMYDKLKEVNARIEEL